MHAYDYFSETLPGIDPFPPFCPPSPYSKQSAGLLLFHLVIRTAAGYPLRMHFMYDIRLLCSYSSRALFILRGTPGNAGRLQHQKYRIVWRPEGIW